MSLFRNHKLEKPRKQWKKKVEAPLVRLLQTERLVLRAFLTFRQHLYTDKGPRLWRSVRY